MLTKLLRTLLFLLVFTNVKSQNSWQLFVGGNYSNIIHKESGEQRIYLHIKDAPLWNYGYQIGMNRNMLINKNLYFVPGLKLQLRGDKKSIFEIAPITKYHNLRFLDFMIPVTIKYRLLKTKDIYYKFGISASYMLHQSKISKFITYFPIDTFKEKLGVSGQMGFEFICKNKISLELLYSQGLTNIYKETDLTHHDNTPTEFIHQDFEFSILYKL